MNPHSRTYNSVKNSTVAIVFYIVNLLLQFVSRKIFIDQLGAELLGLNITIVSIVQFLNIAELGIGTAVACTLYAPLSNRDQVAINEIVSLQGWLYKYIAFIIIGLSSVLLLFFPYILGNSNLPISYSYLTFVVMLFGSLIGYFVNYKQVLLSANQQEYKIQLSYKLTMLLKIVAQIVVVKLSENGYMWWLLMEVVFSILATIALNISIKRTFPHLQTQTSRGAELHKKYPGIVRMTSQLFFHKIASFALTQFSPIVIYAYSTLTEVTKYSNYMLVVTGVVSLLMAMFNGLNAGVGNLVAENNMERIMKVFRELFSMRFVLVSVCSILIYVLLEPFISLWVGTEFLLDKSTLLLIVVVFYINAMRGVVDAFLQAYGLFKDIWAPIVEATLNIGLSFLLGYFMGLDGVLLGMIASLLVIVFLWKPYFLFSKGFKMPISIYVKMYAKHLLILAIVVTLLHFIIPTLGICGESSWSKLLLDGVVLALCLTLIIGSITYVFESGMRDFVKRVLNMLKIRR